MASSTIISSAAAQSSMVAPFTGLRSSSAFPVTRKSNADLSKLPSNGGRVQCMKVWPIEGVKNFSTLSYLPPLSIEALVKKFLAKSSVMTMWSLPMFGCTDAVQVVKELDACKAEYPKAHIRIIGFDNDRQVQRVSFIAYEPPQ